MSTPWKHIWKIFITLDKILTSVWSVNISPSRFLPGNPPPPSGTYLITGWGFQNLLDILEWTKVFTFAGIRTPDLPACSLIGTPNELSWDLQDNETMKGLLIAKCHIQTVYNLFCLSILFSHIYGLRGRIFYSFRPDFEPKAVYIIRVFVVNEVAPEQLFLSVLQFSLVDFIPLILHTHISVINPPCSMFSRLSAPLN